MAVAIQLLLTVLKVGQREEVLLVDRKGEVKIIQEVQRQAQYYLTSGTQIDMASGPGKRQPPARNNQTANRR
jgi:hypothetical protein